MATYSRRRLIRGSLIFVATAVLNACGQKGPLYLPEENEDEKKKNNEKSSALGRRGSSHV